MIIFSDNFYESFLRKFDKTRQGLLNFDDFIQACVVLTTLTEPFRDKDRDRKGKIIISYEDYMAMVSLLSTLNDVL